MVTRHFFVFSMFLTGLFTLAGHSQTLEGCKAFIEGDTLILQNDQTTHYFKWNHGNLIPLKFVNRDGLGLFFPENSLPDFEISEDLSTASEGSLSTSTQRLSTNDDPYLEAVITFKQGKLDVRRVIRIHPGTRLISHHFYLRGEAGLHWGSSPDHGSREMVEKKIKTNSQKVRIGIIPFRRPHWKIKTRVFAEATDHNNTLVQGEEYVAYIRPLGFSGNVIFTSNPLEETSFVVIKEAPLGESQHGYEGADFTMTHKALQIHGLGILPEDVRPDQWTRGYGYAVGVTGKAEKDQLTAIRTYQKAARNLVASRDEMIVANTWGDRSRDSRMNEQFILEEIEAASKMGITHLQLDDGWQQGLSRNSASKAGKKWDSWSREDWQPHKERFPNGFETIVQEAKRKNIEICLWFNASKKDSYSLWERDAEILIDYYQKWGIRVFKMDGIDFSSKQAELNLRKLFDKVLTATRGQVVFNMDVTAGHRMGYHYFTEYGNVFLENRYTDWVNYYPHSTLRNLWMLSRYIPPERLQIEFLNNTRNMDRYQKEDILAPGNVPFAYQIATTLMAQPLAWMELSQLPDEAVQTAAGLFQSYKAVQHDIHKGIILPVGMEPNGFGWTGFQSITDEKEGFLLIFRERHPERRHTLDTWLKKGVKVKLTGLLGKATSFDVVTGSNGSIAFDLPEEFSFALYTYKVIP